MTDMTNLWGKGDNHNLTNKLSIFLHSYFRQTNCLGNNFDVGLNAML